MSPKHSVRQHAPLFSIIIPAYNEASYLGRCLASIKRLQPSHTTEVIVVANGCKDDTAAVAKKQGAIVIELATPSVSKARNVGAQHAKGEILIFLDADTLLAADTLTAIMKAFTPNHAVGTVAVQPFPLRWKYQFLMFWKNLVFSLHLYEGSNGIIFCRRYDFLASHGFSEQLAVKENRYLIKELLKQGTYCFVSTSSVQTSMRRYERWGILATMFFWIMEFFRDWFGNVEKDKYEAVR
ncbi:glycosyltransferase [Candidatus Woesearchaeota archaeon]|nr:glycosyltransferase [Candidatus Woesearchaeota archaeon]